jgi:hypothetical protein
VTLTIPHDLVFEMFLGRWVDVTALTVRRNLRQSDPVSVSWGLPTEQGKALAPPSTAEGVLNNDGGHWTLGNPMSDWYDYLQGRNVLTRLALRVGSDAFGRTLPTTLGPTDTGEVWNTAGVNDSYSVGSGVGNIVLSAAASFGLAVINDSYGDCESRITFDVGSITPTGAPIEPGNPVVRWQGSGAFAGEHYMLRVEVRTDQTIWASIHHSTLGSISGGLVNTGLVNAPGRRFRASIYAEGQALRGQVWDVTNPDRPGWIASCHHDRLAGGFPGFRAGVAAGNTNAKPLALSHDDWELRLYQHVGELASLKPSWDASHKVKKAAFKAADITQRLGRPQRSTLSSAPRRYLAEGKNSDFTATDFWPLDEASSAPAQGLNTAAGGTPAAFLRETGVTPNRGAVKWGESDNFHTAVPGFATLSNGGRLVFTTQQAALGSAWSVMWAMRLSPDAGGQVFLSTAAVANRFVFFLYTDGTYDLFSNPSGSAVSSGVISSAGLDGRWVTLGVTAFPSGADTDVRVFVDGQNRGGGLIAADAGMSPLREVLVHVPQPSTGGQGDSAFSSLFVTASRFDTVSGGKFLGERAHWAIMGWRGENAGLRAFRLTAEEGVPFDYYGDLGVTRVMGPQRPDPLLDQIEECAEVDGAMVFVPRYCLGVVYRPRRALAGQGVTATLSYSLGHVSGISVAADDRPTANYVKAEKIDGGFQIVEQTVGPMNTKNPDALPVDPEAVGRTPAAVKVNVESEAQLGDVGGWVRALGTVPEVRFPSVTVDLANRELTKGVDPTRPAREVTALRPGDRMLVTGMASADTYRDLDQIVRGGKTTFTDTYQHEIKINTAPYEKYKNGVYGSTFSRYDGPGQVTTLDAQLTAGTVGGRAVTTSAGMPWTTSAAAFAQPFYVVVGGEVIQLSGITGTGLAAQTMTISARNVNGLPVAGGKTHPAGTRVRLYQPVYYQ